MIKTCAREFKKGVFAENPIFMMVLGLCPTLAVSTSVVNAIGMGIAATFVLLGSNVIVSLLRTVIPSEIRIPCYIVIIATFVTITELLMKAFSPALSTSLGIFVPLIVVNCIILARAEGFASQRGVIASVFDALGMGAGFTLALVVIAFIRELLGAGMICGVPLGTDLQPALIFILAPGALLTLGFLMAGVNMIRQKQRPAGCGGCGCGTEAAKNG